MKSTKEEIQEIEEIIGKLLRIGVIISAAVIIIGLLLLLITGNSGYPSGAHPTRPGAIMAGVVALKPAAVMMLGLFLLILTPVLRVVVSIYAFIKESDWLYTIITTVVLVILIGAMFIGYAGH
ncbi:DUF1634 domain-containing protein [Lacticaseibacillus saniviri]|uniref:Membrane protein n=1 Tax=Lacticaseibacillus saniviri JCM 17471 = DSM 24301 TaxID=1293598 RepID=A0A0R2MZQ9_9LACO|nr:DUF1634 domain-containing protein [Lacticaseibacillus saniviri]KRO18868.1 membrane protein [Lacticaseibacillus saniviri JCM 17471 = DSM 24301]MCG4281445.1 DUF1634 domain-containing protein [Lacticaseibacillus saniviri]